MAINLIVYIRATLPATRAALLTLPRMLAQGTESIATGYRNGLAFGLLQKITENFAANSAHDGTPDVELNWPPLAESTIQKRLHGTEYRSRMTQKAREKNLTDEQKKQLRKKVNRLKKQYILDGMEPFQALGLARAQVFNEYRRAGAKIPTSREMVPILRDTGIGLNSLTPVAFSEDNGSYQPPRGGTNPDTGEPVEPIYENRSGEVVVGVKGYFSLHHVGGPNLPQRRLWPETHEWPEAWWEHMQEVNDQLLINAAIELARRSQGT